MRSIDHSIARFCRSQTQATTKHLQLLGREMPLHCLEVHSCHALLERVRAIAVLVEEDEQVVLGDRAACFKRCLDW